LRAETHDRGLVRMGRLKVETPGAKGGVMALIAVERGVR
jgi:hypothetical protein